MSMTQTKTPGIVRILFLGGAKRVSMGRKFIDAGNRLGVTVELFSYELTELVPIASIAGIIIGRKWNDPEILQDIRSHVSSKKIDILVPFVDGAVEICARYRDMFGDAWSPTGDVVKCATMFDKIAADQLFRALSLPVPRSGIFPMIAKPRFGSASKGIRLIHNDDERVSLNNASCGEFLFQEYILNRTEITVDCYVSLAGDLIAAVPRYRIETQGGEASVTETFHDSGVEILAAETLHKTGLRGAVTIQMLRDTTDDRLMLMEINPRLGGGAVCACHAGASLPEFILRDFLSMSLEPCKNWKSGIRICRYFDEVCFDLSTC